MASRTRKCQPQFLSELNPSVSTTIDQLSTIMKSFSLDPWTRFSLIATVLITVVAFTRKFLRRQQKADLPIFNVEADVVKTLEDAHKKVHR